MVIGGLIDDLMTRTSYGVPCLGDIPLIGWLFKTDSMMPWIKPIFLYSLTPKVVANPAEAEVLYKAKKRQ